MPGEQHCNNNTKSLRRSASFDITQLNYYHFNHCNHDNNIKGNCGRIIRSHSVHELPSQFEFTSQLVQHKLLMHLLHQEDARSGEIIESKGGVGMGSTDIDRIENEDETEMSGIREKSLVWGEQPQSLREVDLQCMAEDNESFTNCSDATERVRSESSREDCSVGQIMDSQESNEAERWVGVGNVVGGCVIRKATETKHELKAPIVGGVDVKVEDHSRSDGKMDGKIISGHDGSGPFASTSNKIMTVSTPNNESSVAATSTTNGNGVESSIKTSNDQNYRSTTSTNVCVDIPSESQSTIKTTNSVKSSTETKNCQDNSSPTSECVDILTEGQYFLSISMLVYMYSHLRETCRMGHTRVRMEEIDCNNSSTCYRRSSLSSMEEIDCYDTSSRRLSSSSFSFMGSVPSLPLSRHQQQKEDEQQSSYLTNTLTAGSIIRVVIDELDDYDNDYGDDCYDQGCNISSNYQRDYEQTVMKEFRKWIEDSRVSRLDSKTQNLIASLRKNATKARWRRAMGMFKVTHSVRKLVNIDGGMDNKKTNANRQQMVHHLKRQLARYRWKRAIARVRLGIKLGGGKYTHFSTNGKLEGNRFVNTNEFLQKGLENGDKYFMEGSVMSNLIESSLEVVWFSDVTQNDVVYGICVQREEKKITVVFRGTVNAHNWSMNLRYDMMTVRNPIREYYPGRVEKLDLHCGFALYLLRKRKDTRMSKMSEIFDKVEQIGKELAPDGDYKICITGHSLGGALASLFGFFLGVKLCQSHHVTNRKIQIYTFASPRVGGLSFLYAYQHLERLGRIRHARFSTSNDIVPLIPFCNFRSDNLKFYKHVGMRVQLHSTGSVGKWRLRKRLDISYPLFHDWFSTIARSLMNCILVNPSTPQGYKMHHTLTEYQTRLHFALTYRKALASTVFYLDQKRQRLKSLDEYYAFRSTMNVDISSYEDSMPSTEGVNVFKQLRKAFIVIPLMYMWTRLLSKVTRAEIIIPKLLHWIFKEVIQRVVRDIPFLTMLQHLLKISFGLTVALEVVNVAIKIRHIRLLVSKKTSSRLILVAPMLFAWSRLIFHLTNTAIPTTIHHSLLQQALNVGKMASLLVMPLWALLRLSFGLSFVMVALSMQMRSQSSRWMSRLGKISFALLMMVGWVVIFTKSSEKMARDVPVWGVAPNSNTLGWGIDGERLNYGIIESNANTIDMRNRSESSTVPIDLGESKLRHVHEQLQPITEYATGIKFAPTLDNGLYLVGAGVRKKSVIKVYAVAMYSGPKVLVSASSSPASLHNAARTFDSPTSMTSFVLEMVYSAGAEKIAGAIAESVKPRYHGSTSDVVRLETLIVEGVNGIGGQATKGTTFRFDCSGEGVAVNVNGVEQGVAAFDGLGSAFVDVFMDGNSVSPTLKDSCVSTWSTDENKSIAASLAELESTSGRSNQVVLNETTAVDEPHIATKLESIESQVKPIQEYATSVVFNPKLEDGLYLVGAGVRKKSVVKVYAVALYGSASVLSSISSPASLHYAARSFDASTSSTTFMLEMTYSASAEKIGGAIADSVKPRYSGSASDIRVLESLIVEGVKRKGGQASKGTIFRFDCSEEGVTVSVDGFVQGTATAAGLGSAFVDVFLDDNAVSPTLVSSCMDTWSNPRAQTLSASLLELNELQHDVATTGREDSSEEIENQPSLETSIIPEEVESQLQPITEYATGIKFAPTLDKRLYLIGAGVRKKSVIKVYAVAMYSTSFVLSNAGSPASLHDAARTFDSPESVTSFVLEMVYSAGAEKIAGAIAESVKPRYGGESSDIDMLEGMIVEGVNGIGGQATKGTTFRFDCSGEGVAVNVNGVEQGVAAFDGLGSAFVDVFMDGNSVSPTLKDSCVSTWSTDEAKLLISTLLGLNETTTTTRDHQSHDAESGSPSIEDNDKVEIGTSTTEANVNIKVAEEQRTEVQIIFPSKSDENKIEEAHHPKLNTPPKKHNLFKTIIKFAFPVF